MMAAVATGDDEYEEPNEATYVATATSLLSQNTYVLKDGAGCALLKKTSLCLGAPWVLTCATGIDPILMSALICVADTNSFN